jgi:hypothetical protein
LIASALRNGSRHQSGGQWWSNVADDVEATRRFAKHSDVLCISTKPYSIGLNPSQCQLLVHQAVIASCVAFGIEGWMGEKTERLEPIIHCDDNYSACVYQRTWVVRFTCAARVSAAVNKDHHRAHGFTDELSIW